jgi:pilus assembly protein Flp/PilA
LEPFTSSLINFGLTICWRALVGVRQFDGSANERLPQGEEGVMGKVLQLLKKLARDEEGAALVEYTVLLGIMLVAVVTTIGLVGGWVNTKWTALFTALSAN